MKTCLLLPALLAAAGLPLPSLAQYKCVVDGQTSYQGSPCPQEQPTVAQDLQRRQRLEALHQRLDRLQAQGVGMVANPVTPRLAAQNKAAQNETAQIVAAKPQALQNQPWHRMNDQDVERERKRKLADLGAASERHNQATAARMQADVDRIRKECGGHLQDWPVVGMSDEQFRRCTAQARFNAAVQIVVADDQGVPLRLYIYGTARAQRVYAVDGVLTAVRP